MGKILNLLLNTGLILTLLSPNAWSGPNERERILGTVFSTMEKETILDYYKGRYGKHLPDAEEIDRPKKAKKHKGKKKKGLPPGLAKRKTLPPGLAKQLERNGRLPPGLEKRELPSSLESMLPSVLPGYERTLVDNDVVLIERATGVIMDILRDVF